MKKVLLHENKEGIESYLKGLNKFLPAWQKVVDECVKLELEPNLEELTRLWYGAKQCSNTKNGDKEYVENFVREKLADKVAIPQIGGVKLNREKFLDMIALPDCVAFLEALQAFMFSAEYLSENTKYYTIQDNVVVISTDSMEEIKELPQHRIYATTEKQMTACTHVQTIVDELKKLSTMDVRAFCKCDLISYDDGVPRVNYYTISNIQ